MLRLSLQLSVPAKRDNFNHIKGLNVPSTNQESSQDVLQLADEITRYLKTHSNVADTLEGIAHWWILRQRLHEEHAKVEQAMEYLCAQGIVEAVELRDGKILYRPVPTDVSSTK